MLPHSIRKSGQAGKRWDSESVYRSLVPVQKVDKFSGQSMEAETLRMKVAGHRKEVRLGDREQDV